MILQCGFYRIDFTIRSAEKVTKFYKDKIQTGGMRLRLIVQTVRKQSKKLQLLFQSTCYGKDKALQYPTPNGPS